MKKLLVPLIIIYFCSSVLANDEWIYFTKVDSNWTSSVWKIKPDGSDSSFVFGNALVWDVSDDGNFLLLNTEAGYIVQYSQTSGIIDTISQLTIRDPWEGGIPKFALNDEIIVYSKSEIDSLMRRVFKIYAYNFNSNITILLADSLHYETNFALSPNKDRIAYYQQTDFPSVVYEPDSLDNIVVVNLVSGESKIIASNAKPTFDGWSHLAWGTSDYIFYEGVISFSDSIPQIWRASVDTLENTQITTLSGWCIAPIASNDTAEEIIFSEFVENSGILNCNLYLYDINEENIQMLYSYQNDLVYSKIWSPDNSKIAICLFVNGDDPSPESAIKVIDIESKSISNIALGVLPIWVGGEITRIDLIPNPKIPTHFSLKQNYPNPFNSFTTIKYHLPNSSFVNLTIYNNIGQLVETLVYDQVEAGVHTITWYAKNFSSGVYFYKFTTNIYSETRKCILIK